MDHIVDLLMLEDLTDSPSVSPWPLKATSVLENAPAVVGSGDDLPPGQDIRNLASPGHQTESIFTPADFSVGHAPRGGGPGQGLYQGQVRRGYKNKE